MSRTLPPVMAEGRGAQLAALALIGVVQAVLLGIAAFATRDAFAALHDGGAPAAATLVVLVAAGATAAACEAGGRVLGEGLGQRYASAVRVALYRALAAWPRDALRSRRLGALALRFVGDLSAVRRWFGLALPGLVSTAAALPGVAIVLLLLNQQAGLAALAPVVLALGAMGLAGWQLRHRQRRLRSRRASVAIAAMERLAMAPELDLMGRTPKELDALTRQSDKLREGAVARERRTALLRILPQIGTAVGGALVLLTAARSGMEAGTAAAMLAMLAILGLQLRDLAEAWDAGSAWGIARAKLLAVLARAQAPRVTDARGAPVAVAVQGPRLSFFVPAGCIARLTGPPGAGKTQLAEIIAGLSRDDSVSVHYDGAAHLPRVAHLGARPPILRGSLRRTLTLGVDPRPATKELTQAARAFGLSHLLSRIGGVRGRVEGPDALSEGETVRIALARAALSSPELVVIDNAALRADPDAAVLLSLLREAAPATMVIVGEPPMPGAVQVALDQAAHERCV
jgi:ABC-type transport system involved in cytochrome bd biosynthesis fused ATPase/permease subunit